MLALEPGKTYHFKSNVHGPGANVPWFEIAEVWLGTDRTVEAMDVLLLERTLVQDYMSLEVDFTVPEAGNYCLAVRSVSEPEQWEIALFDIYVGENIEDPVDKLAPAEGQVILK